MHQACPSTSRPNSQMSCIIFLRFLVRPLLGLFGEADYPPLSFLVCPERLETALWLMTS